MKKVLVTGSTGAIGEAIARYFHDNGYFVYLHYRSNEKKANELKNELENSEILGFDITNKDNVFKKLDGIEVDVLVNNAGITKDKLFFMMEEDEWDSVVDTSLKGSFLL